MLPTHRLKVSKICEENNGCTHVDTDMHKISLRSATYSKSKGSTYLSIDSSAHILGFSEDTTTLSDPKSLFRHLLLGPVCYAISRRLRGTEPTSYLSLFSLHCAFALYTHFIHEDIVLRVLEQHFIHEACMEKFLT